MSTLTPEQEKAVAELRAIKQPTDGWITDVPDHDIVISSRENYERIMDENTKLKELLEQSHSNQLQREVQLKDCQERLAAERDLREKLENDVDEEWLNAIATYWNAFFGRPFDTRDGETREEGLQANVGAMFQELERVTEQLAAEKSLREKAQCCIDEAAKAHEATVAKLEQSKLNIVSYEKEVERWKERLEQAQRERDEALKNEKHWIERLDAGKAIVDDLSRKYQTACEKLSRVEQRCEGVEAKLLAAEAAAAAKDEAIDIFIHEHGEPECATCRERLTKAFSVEGGKALLEELERLRNELVRLRDVVCEEDVRSIDEAMQPKA